MLSSITCKITEYSDGTSTLIVYNTDNQHIKTANPFHSQEFISMLKDSYPLDIYNILVKDLDIEPEYNSSYLCSADVEQDSTKHSISKIGLLLS